MNRTIPLLMMALLAPAVTAAQSSTSTTSPRRFRVLANVNYNPNERTFEETETFTEFLEQGSLRQSYRGGTGISFEIGGIYSITQSFGVLGSFELASAEHDLMFDVDEPHPLLFDRNRSVSGELSGLDYTEQAVHLDLVYTVDSGSWTIDVFGGATFLFVEAELLDEATTTSAYPFDELELSGTSTVKLDDNPIGVNAGGALTYWLTSSIGAAFNARYTAATAELERDGGLLELDAGGLRFGGGVRISF